jgi:hypothetical protein
MSKKRFGREWICITHGGRKSDPRLPAFPTSRRLDNASGTLYAPAESLWLLDCAIPYCRILYSSAL